jgi:hypothetical protein
MPPVPVLPNPVATPTGLYYVSGGTGVVTSAGPMVPSSLSGPWYEEEQTMSLYYSRAPFAGYTGNTPTLSSLSTTYAIHNTKLLTGVTASYQIRKTYGVYPNQTWQQPQKFTILAVSADYLNNTYGDLDASSTGPAGNVVTSQPYRLRRPWITGTDTEVYAAAEGWNFCVQRFGCPESPGGVISHKGGQSPLMSDFTKSVIKPTSIGTINQPQDINYQSGPRPYSSYFSHPSFYYIPGGYAANKESWQQVIDYINGCGNLVSTSKLWTDPSDNTVTSTPSSGFAQYNIQRHSFL